MNIISPIFDQFIFFFIDYILVYSRSKEDHAQRLMTSLQLIRSNLLHVKVDKWDFLLEKVAFLWHTIFKDGVFVDPTKIEVIVNWESSKNVTKEYSRISWLL